jgi:dipeptide/tripeptide permease
VAGPQNESELSTIPFSQQLRSFGLVYWIANWMELVERFAYYGVRVLLPVFLVAAIANGGPELDHKQKGEIYAVWAVVQSFVPILSGGFADRFGYKINIALSTVLKMIGYLIMGYTVALSNLFSGTPLAEARLQNADYAYEVFFIGAMFLATGTAIFKPGVQGLIAAKMPKSSASLGWGLFYQMVNIGGFLGPLVAGFMRANAETGAAAAAKTAAAAASKVTETTGAAEAAAAAQAAAEAAAAAVSAWQVVFWVCAAAIALNFVPLFFFKDPARPEQSESPNPMVLLYRALKGLLEPRLFFFTISFAGFWLMFFQLFDILPNFIEDWVDSRGVAGALASVFGSDVVPTLKGANQGNLTQEWMINFNALLISLLAFAMGYFTGKMRSLTAIVIGIGISAAGIYALGMSMNGWWTIAAIATFSMGEMMASPTKMRYLAGIAPPGKEGLYMGYANFTVGIGWSIGSVVAGNLYQESGDKIVLAKKYMEANAEQTNATIASLKEDGKLLDFFGKGAEKAGDLAGSLSELKKEKALEFFEMAYNMDAWQTRELLWSTYEPYSMWLLFTGIGLASMLAILIYDRVVRAADANPDHTLNTKGHVWVNSFLIPICLLFVAANVYDARAVSDSGEITWNMPSIGLLLNAVFFWTMLSVSVLGGPDLGDPSTEKTQPEETLS